MASALTGALRYTSVVPRATSILSNSKSAEQQQQQEVEQSPPPPLKKQPRQRWQWSKGDGPGEYGGPPLDFRVRRVWGGVKEDAADPITSTDDYIWNKDWQNHLPPLPSPSPSSSSATSTSVQAKPVEAGFLSLNRSIALDRMDVDLSKELVKPTKSVLALQVEAARRGLPTDKAIRQDKPRWRMAPTRREQKQWARARSGEGMAIPVRDGMPNNETKASSAIQQYSQVKGNLQVLTVLFGGLGTSVAYFSYSAEIALSYAVGLLGSLAYIRMLGNSVDSLGQSDSKSAVRGALGQQRLLVPVVLVMLFNRWNQIIAPEFHLLHLELIPVLVGFFTYKAATISQVLTDILQDSFEERDL